jgi:hypothetical protein
VSYLAKIKEPAFSHSPPWREVPHIFNQAKVILYLTVAHSLFGVAAMGEPHSDKLMLAAPGSVIKLF